MSESKKIRVLCVDDSQDLTDVLVRMVDSQSDLQSVGALDCADDVVAEVGRLEADVVVMDLTMPGLPPLEAIATLAASQSGCRVVAFTGYDDPATQSSAIRAGAWAVVSKTSEPDAVIRAIRRVAAC